MTKLTDQEIRIKLDVLAEAMGRFYHVHGVKKYDPHFRPDTDANDDYAVLEWAKTQGFEFYKKFLIELAMLITSRVQTEGPLADLGTELHFGNQKKGDYARAALKVMT